MAIINQSISVGTVVVNIVEQDDNPQEVSMHNSDGSHSIWVGSSTVTTANGFEIEKKEALQIVVAPGDQLYAIADGANRDLRVLIRKT